mgnify:CR=1 FL=1
MELVVKLESPKKKDIEKISTKVSGKDLYKIIKEHKKEMKDHFKESGHDLDLGFIVDDISYQLLGFHLSDLIYASLVDKGTEVAYSGKGAMLRKSDGYFPVFYDTYTGELIIVDNARESKDYIFEYSENNGYEFLGPL